MYYYKQDSEIKVRKLLFCFFVLLNKFKPELLKLVRNALSKSGIFGQEENTFSLTNFQGLSNLISNLSYRLIFGKDTKDSSLEKFMEIFETYINKNN